MFHLRTRITRDELVSCAVVLSCDLAYLLRVDGLLLCWYILTHTFSVCVLEISIISVGVYSAVFKYFCNTRISGRSYIGIVFAPRLARECVISSRMVMVRTD